MKAHVEAVTGHSTMLTIGTVTRNGEPLWDVDGKTLSQMKAMGKYHVWLTLPWLDIMDFTLSVSLREQQGIDPNGASPICGDPDLLAPGYSWAPVFVGDDATSRLLTL